MPGVAFSIQTWTRVPPDASSVNSAFPLAFEPLRDSMFAVAFMPAAVVVAVLEDPQDTARTAAAPTTQNPRLLMASSSKIKAAIIPASEPMLPAVPPVAVSRPLLFGLVAVGAVVAVVTPQPTSSFAAGVAAGAGSAFVVSFMRTSRHDRFGDSDDRPGDGS